MPSPRSSHARRGSGRRRHAVLITALLAAVIAICGCGAAVSSGQTASAGSSTPTATSASASTSASATTSPTATATRAAPVGRLTSFTVTAAGRRRTYLLYVPRSASTRHKLPLVLVYHGVDQTAQDASVDTNLLSSDEHSGTMILAYMQGYGDSWNEETGGTPAAVAHVNDVAFTSSVVSRLEHSEPVDRSHVVAVGFSNGALLAETLGCRLAGTLTGIMPIEGPLTVAVSQTCRPAHPISVYEVHATGDQTIPYTGGEFDGVGGYVDVLSAQGSVRRWAGLDGCARTPSTVSFTGGRYTRYRRCRAGTSVTLDTILGGSHTWPSNLAQLVVSLL